MWAISVLGNAKSNRHRKTHGVELDGAGRKYKPLPGEISVMRVAEKSAKSVVAQMHGESRAERRDEESRKWCPNRACGAWRETVERQGALQLRQPPPAALEAGRVDSHPADSADRRVKAVARRTRDATQ
jgi:hypothetical protein